VYQSLLPAWPSPPYNVVQAGAVLREASTLSRWQQHQNSAWFYTLTPQLLFVSNKAPAPCDKFCPPSSGGRFSPMGVFRADHELTDYQPLPQHDGTKVAVVLLACSGCPISSAS